MKNANKDTVINEVQLFDKDGYPDAIRVSLDDVLKFINANYSDLSAEVFYDDGDDYGSDHCVIIRGDYANIVIEKFYGGIHCQTDSLLMGIQPLLDRDGLEAKRLWIKNEKDSHKVGISSNYESRIKEYIDSKRKYLAGKELFTHVDQTPDFI